MFITAVLIGEYLCFWNSFFGDFVFSPMFLVVGSLKSSSETSSIDFERGLTPLVTKPRFHRLGKTSCFDRATNQSLTLHIILTLSKISGHIHYVWIISLYLDVHSSTLFIPLCPSFYCRVSIFSSDCYKNFKRYFAFHIKLIPWSIGWCTDVHFSGCGIIRTLPL